MASTITILTISSDALLQATRTILLTRAGYSVIELSTYASLLKFVEAASYSRVDLVLMCHSVEEFDRLRFCTVLRQRYPTTPILMLYTIYESIPPEVNCSLQSLVSPQELLGKVEALLQPSSKPAQHRG